MRTTIDKAGRVVIPKPIRDALGLTAGADVDIEIDGASIRIDPPELPEPEITLVDGWFKVIHFAEPLPADFVQQERDARLDYLENL